MHERRLMQDMITQIARTAAAQGATRVVGVKVWIGALSHFSAEGFERHFRQAATGSCAETARLELTVSDDIRHPDAQGVVIESIDITRTPDARE